MNFHSQLDLKYDQLWPLPCIYLLDYCSVKKKKAIPHGISVVLQKIINELAV